MAVSYGNINCQFVDNYRCCKNVFMLFGFIPIRKSCDLLFKKSCKYQIHYIKPEWVPKKLIEIAKKKYGKEYYKECPSKEFNIACCANDDFPDCGSKECWIFHGCDRVDYNTDVKKMVKQQFFGR